MKKDKKTQVKPEGKIKHMLRTNYWLTPLLLVALVFAIVFGVSKIPALKTTIQGWFNKQEKCKSCEVVKFDALQQKIEVNEEGKIFYVVITQADCAGCEELFPVLNKFLKTNKSENNIDILSLDVSMKDENTFKDNTITIDKFNTYKDTFTALGKGELMSPAIIKYNGTKMVDTIIGSGSSYNDLMEFFGVKN